MELIDTISYSILIPMTFLLGFAPFYPSPHIYEKLSMLKNGTLKKPLDIFDLLYHISPFVVLFIKVSRDISR
jgi:hypothetical protein